MSQSLKNTPPSKPLIEVTNVSELSDNECQELCGAAQESIAEGGGFGWLKPLPIHTFERFWQGVLLVPERQLLIAKLDRTVAGSVQLVRPSKQLEARRLNATLTTLFIAPWARGHGLARALIKALEQKATQEGFQVIEVEIRDTQKKALQLFAALGYQRWGSNPRYAHVNNKWVSGSYLHKLLK